MAVHEIPVGTETFGKAFEHLIALELRAYLSYRRLNLDLGFWRSEHGHEVDFTIGSKVAIEVKATDLVQERHISGLRALQEEGIFSSHCVVSRDRSVSSIEGITVYPWRTFLDKLLSGELDLISKGSKIS